MWLSANFTTSVINGKIASVQYLDTVSGNHVAFVLVLSDKRIGAVEY